MPPKLSIHHALQAGSRLSPFLASLPVAVGRRHVRCCVRVLAAQLLSRSSPWLAPGLIVRWAPLPVAADRWLTAVGHSGAQTWR